MIYQAKIFIIRVLVHNVVLLAAALPSLFLRGWSRLRGGLRFGRLGSRGLLGLGGFLGSRLLLHG